MKAEENSVRVQFEIGHEASLKSKKTPEGFTHDWEVFVRGADNTEIQCFVDKVVFHLHETFQKPKRVVKDPPYSVKESGYAGFIVPIDVYLKNKEEPKKIKFQYDLNLQNSGPPISHVIREPRVFQNPSEDFRRKLIRGGGVGIDDASKQHKTKTESPVKKPKLELPLSNSFADLFGTPIRRITPEPKKTEPVKQKIETDVKKSSKTPQKEKVKPVEKKDRIKDKPKRPPSPAPPLPPPAPKKEEEKKKHEEKKHEKKKEEKRPKEEKEVKVDKTEVKEIRKDAKSEIVEKEKVEKHKKKHKKKEKERDKEKTKEEMKDKEKKKKHEEVKEKIIRKSRSPSPPSEKTKKRPLSALYENIGSSYSHSSLSDDEESISSLSNKIVPEKPPLNTKPKSTNLNSSNERNEDSKHKKRKGDEKKKRKERSVSSEREEERLRKEKEENDERERIEREKQRFEKERLEKEAVEKIKKEKKHKKEKGERSEVANTKKKEPDSESKCDKFSKEYVAQLRDLQHRIMTLEDSAELQKVVQVIAETGRYEITQKTFDFDLCDLDETTVTKLQDFFSST